MKKMRGGRNELPFSCPKGNSLIDSWQINRNSYTSLRLKQEPQICSGSALLCHVQFVGVVSEVRYSLVETIPLQCDTTRGILFTQACAQFIHVGILVQTFGVRHRNPCASLLRNFVDLTSLIHSHNYSCASQKQKPGNFRSDEVFIVCCINMVIEAQLNDQFAQSTMR